MRSLRFKMCLALVPVIALLASVPDVEGKGVVACAEEY